MNIRKATLADAGAIGDIIEPIIRAGESYALPWTWTRAQMVLYWFDAAHAVFVAEDDGIVGTYFIQPNQRGGGAHVANCGYATLTAAMGRGIARQMCLHSLVVAAERGYRAMQFNFVVASNVRAVKLWSDLGFAVIGRIPEAFEHPSLGYVDALVMHRRVI